jgi:hypothetical protein
VRGIATIGSDTHKTLLFYNQRAKILLKIFIVSCIVVSMSIKDAPLKELWLSYGEMILAKQSAIPNVSLLNLATSYEPIKQLFVEAQKVAQRLTKSSLEVLVVPQGSIPRNGRLIHDRACNKIRILINCTCTCLQALIVLIQELANVLFIAENNELFRLALNGRICKREFVVRVESLEHKSVLIFNCVVKLLKKDWPQTWAMVPLGFDSLEEHLLMQEKGGHNIAYEEFWQKYCSNQFIENVGNYPECSSFKQDHLICS